MPNSKLIRNAYVNILRGGITAATALLGPYFLSRILSSESYGIWLLILQLASYASLLDIGMQTSVGQLVARNNELGDFRVRDNIVSTALSILFILMLIAMTGIIILSSQLQNLFPNVPQDLLRECGWSLILIGGSLAVSLPFSVFNGVFIGLQRYEVPALVVSLNKVLSASLPIVAAYYTQSLIFMSATVAIVSLLCCPIQYVAYKYIAKNVKIGINLVRRSELKNILKSCGGLTIWSVGMLIVSGLDVLVVAYFDYKSISYYAVAATLITFISGFQGSIFTVFMPYAATLDARGEAIELGNLLLKITRYGCLVSLITGIPLIIFAYDVLFLWVGKNYADQGTLILQVLIFANLIRSVCIPYGAIVIGVGQQHLLMLSPVLEAIINLFSSVLLCKIIGPVGVAVGTLVGAIVLTSCNILYNVPRTNKIFVDPRKLFIKSVFEPLLCTLPLLVYGILRSSISTKSLDLILGSLSLFLTFGSAFNFCLSASEQYTIYSKLGGRLFR
jgi:O-antigen/teichoic acid export membrane protein